MANDDTILHARELAPERLAELRQEGRLDLDLLLNRELWDGRTHVRRNAAAALILYEELEHPRLSLLTIAARDGDPVVREHAVTAIGRVRLAASDTVAALLQARLDKVAPVAEAALRSLERAMLQRPAEVAPLLVPALGHAQPAVRRTAADLLLQGSAHSVRPLAASLGHGDPRFADECASLLDQLGSLATDALLDAIADAHARARALKLLRHHPPRTKSQRERLTRLAAGGEGEAARAAAQLEVDLRRQTARTHEPVPLPHPEMTTRLLGEDELQALAKAGEVAPLERALASDSEQARANAIQALALMEDAGPWRRGAGIGLKDASAAVRLQAARTAAARATDAAPLADTLARAAGDPHTDVAEAALEALDQLARVAPLDALDAAAVGSAATTVAVAARLARLPAKPLEALVNAAVESSRGQVRRLGVEIAGLASSPKGVGATALVAAMSDPIDEVRVRAAWALGQLGGAEDLRRQALSGAQLDPVAAVRREAFLSLAKLDGRKLPSAGPDDALPEPVEGFFSRALSSEVLARVAKGAGAEAMGALLRDGRAVVRRNAAGALGSLGAEGTSQLAALQAALRDTDALVRQTAVAAASAVSTGQAHERARALVSALHDRSAPVREAAEQVIEGLGIGALDALIDAFDQDPGFVRGYIFPLVSRLGEPALPALLALPGHSSPQRRGLAAELLGKLATWEMAPARKALEAMAVADPDLAVRGQAKRALQRLSAADASRRLREAAPSPVPGFDERPLSLAELTKAKAKLDPATLLGLLADGRTLVRVNAATALEATKPQDEATVGALALRLRDAEPSVRLAAARALGAQGAAAAAALPDLTGALRNADAELEQALVTAIGHHAKELVAQLPVYLTQRPEVVTPTIGRLAQRAPELMVEALGQCVLDAESLVARENAADILTLLGGRGGVGGGGGQKALEIDEVLLRCKIVRALALAAKPNDDLRHTLEALADTDPHLAVQDAVESALRILRGRARR